MLNPIEKFKVAIGNGITEFGNHYQPTNLVKRTNSGLFLVIFQTTIVEIAQF